MPFFARRLKRSTDNMPLTPKSQANFHKAFGSAVRRTRMVNSGSIGSYSFHETQESANKIPRESYENNAVMHQAPTNHYFSCSVALENKLLRSSRNRYPAGTSIREIAVANMTPKASEMAMGIKN